MSEDVKPQTGTSEPTGQPVSEGANSSPQSQDSSTAVGGTQSGSTVSGTGSDSNTTPNPKDPNASGVDDSDPETHPAGTDTGTRPNATNSELNDSAMAGTREGTSGKSSGTSNEAADGVERHATATPDKPALQARSDLKDYTNVSKTPAGDTVSEHTAYGRSVGSEGRLLEGEPRQHYANEKAWENKSIEEGNHSPDPDPVSKPDRDAEKS